MLPAWTLISINAFELKTLNTLNCTQPWFSPFKFNNNLFSCSSILNVNHIICSPKPREIIKLSCFLKSFPFTFAVTLCHCQLCILLFWHLIFPAVKIFANVQCPMFNPALPLLAQTFIFRHFTPPFQSLLFHSSWTKSRLFYFLRYQMNYPTAEWSKQWASERVSEKAIEFFRSVPAWSCSHRVLSFHFQNNQFEARVQQKQRMADFMAMSNKYDWLPHQEGACTHCVPM